MFGSATKSYGKGFLNEDLTFGQRVGEIGKGMLNLIRK
jgi:hypothetical protein